MVKQLLWRLSTLACVLAAGAGSAAAQTYNCNGTLPAGSYNALNVPAGDTCTLSSGAVSVATNVTVGSGAALIVNGSATFTVNGSLLFMHSAGGGFSSTGPVNILGSMSVNGITDGSKIDGEFFVGGTLSISNSPGSLGFGGIGVGGSVIVQNNTGGVVLDGNTIGGSLTCSGNSPAPTDGGVPNTVGGNKIGQCSSL